MKKKEFSQLKEKSVKELSADVLELKKKISLDYMKIRVGKETNLKTVKQSKKDLAQTLTVLGQVKREGVTK